MKKTYESPVAEKIEFRYEDQVVASGKVICFGVTGTVTNGSGQSASDTAYNN